jgi:uncharacterized protein
MRRMSAALLTALALLAPAAAGAQACGGEDMVERLRRDDGAAYERLLTDHARIPNGTGNFWRIEKEGRKASYLFGTAHVSDARTIRLMEGIEEALSASDVLLVEVDEEALMQAATMLEARAMLPEGETLDARLSEEERALMAVASAGHGLPWFSARRMKPAFLHVTMSVPPCAKLALLRGEQVLDERIVAAAREAGLEVEGLETADEQLSVLGRLDDDIQLAALLEALRAEPDLTEDLHETVIALHIKGMAAMAFPLMEALGSTYPASRAAMEDMREPLIEARNRLMAERALPYLEKGGAFIAVGALHLSGETGLVEGLRRAGYQVTVID